MPVFSWGFVWRSSKRAPWIPGDRGTIDGADLASAAAAAFKLHGLSVDATDLAVHTHNGVPFIQLELEHPDSDSPTAAGLLQVTPLVQDPASGAPERSQRVTSSVITSQHLQNSEEPG